MDNQIKERVICVICNMVPLDPVTLPCDCISCNVHLHDHSAINNKITCLKCNLEFQIPKEGFRSSHKAVKNIINNKLF